MDAILGHRGEARPRGDRGQRARPRRRRTAAGRSGTLRRAGDAELPRDEELHCGEGGALVVNDAALVERAEIIREKGTNRSRFFRGQVDKYTWVDVGSSYLPSDLLAAFLTAQLESFDYIQKERMNIWSTYATELRRVGPTNTASAFPIRPPHTQHPAHLFWLLAPDLECRQRFIAHLAADGIKAVFHYVPLHNSMMGPLDNPPHFR